MSCVKSVCDRDQNWIKRSRSFLEANQEIKVTSKLLKSMDQEYVAAIRPLTLENQVVRRVNQVIKRTFCWSNIMITVTNTSTGDMWLPLGMPHHKCHCRCSPSLSLHLQLTSRNLFFLGKTLSNIYTRRKQMIISHHVASFIPSSQPQLSLNS